MPFKAILLRLDRALAPAALSVLGSGLVLTVSEWCVRTFVLHSSPPPFAVLVALLCGHCLATLVVGGLLWGSAVLARRLPWPRHLLLALITFLAVLPLAFALGRSLTAGDWVARQAFAPALRFGLTLAVPAFAAAAAWCLFDRWQLRFWRVLLLLGGLAALFVNSTVLPGLYPEAHLSLYVASVVALALACSWLTSSFEPRGQGWVAVVVVALLPASIVEVAETRGAIARQAAGLSVALATFAPVSSTHLRQALGALDKLPPHFAPRAAEATALKQRPTSVLLIVVDALRGDALLPVRNGDEPFPAKTPNLDRWLKGAYRFRNSYSQASFTRGSMPSMFRSVETFEDPEKTGLPLGALASEVGLHPVAVVPQYFLLPVRPGGHTLLDGFDAVEFYEKEHQEAIVPEVRTVLTGLGQTPFFGWVHFYNMHLPYFTGQAPASATSKAQRYGAALSWLDARFGELLQTLDDLGLSQSTMIVLTADHGEHLGEAGRSGHGDGVSEEELHVPLAIKLPGYPGAEVNPIVGNIDVLPTIVDALGHSPRADQRGGSLLPLITTGQASSERALYSRSGSDAQMALLTQEHKLVFNRAQNTFALFQREQDPSDDKDLLLGHPELGDPLVAELVRRNPGLFAEELGNAEMSLVLAQALTKVPLSPPTPTLDFLLKTVVASKDPGLRLQAGELFDKTQDLSTRLLLSRALAAADPAEWTKRWERVLVERAKQGKDFEVVEGLVHDHFVAKGSAVAPNRIAALAKVESDPLLNSWLRLVLPWPKATADYTPVFLELLTSRRAKTEPLSVTDLGVVELTLDNVASLPRAKGRSSLEEPTLAWLGSDSMPVVRAACRALARVGSAAAVKALRAIVEGHHDARARQAALRSVGAIAPKKAYDLFVEAANDPLLVGDSIQLLGKLGDRRALPLLGKLATKHPNQWTRDQAKRAAAAIRKAPKKPRK